MAFISESHVVRTMINNKCPINEYLNESFSPQYQCNKIVSMYLSKLENIFPPIFMLYVKRQHDSHELQMFLKGKRHQADVYESYRSVNQPTQMLQTLINESTYQNSLLQASQLVEQVIPVVVEQVIPALEPDRASYCAFFFRIIQIPS